MDKAGSQLSLWQVYQEDSPPYEEKGDGSVHMIICGFSTEL
jgi:hypothetical protein